MTNVTTFIWKFKMTIPSNSPKTFSNLVKQRQTSRILKEIYTYRILLTMWTRSGHIKCIFFNFRWKYVTASVDDGQHKVHGRFYLFTGFNIIWKVYVLFCHYLHNISCCSKFSTQKYIFCWKKEIGEKKSVEISRIPCGTHVKKYILSSWKAFRFFPLFI